MWNDVLTMGLAVIGTQAGIFALLLLMSRLEQATTEPAPARADVAVVRPTLTAVPTPAASAAPDAVA